MQHPLQWSMFTTIRKDNAAVEQLRKYIEAFIYWVLLSRVYRDLYSLLHPLNHDGQLSLRQRHDHPSRHRRPPKRTSRVRATHVRRNHSSRPHQRRSESQFQTPKHIHHRCGWCSQLPFAPHTWVDWGCGLLLSHKNQAWRCYEGYCCCKVCSHHAEARRSVVE